MKKILAVILIFTLSLALCACSRECSCGCEYCCGGEIPEHTAAPATEVPAVAQATIVPSETSEPEAENAILVVEDFQITEINDTEIWFKVKIRNISDSDLERISFQYQVLDQNGDILHDQSCGAYNVAAGQAIWAGVYCVQDLHMEDAAAMCFVSDPWDTAKLTQRVIFRIEDYR